MSRIVAVCQCGKPPAAAVAVMVYSVPWTKSKHKLSKTFHLCSDCIIKLHDKVKTQLTTALRATYGSLTE